MFKKDKISVSKIVGGECSRSRDSEEVYETWWEYISSRADVKALFT